MAAKKENSEKETFTPQEIKETLIVEGDIYSKIANLRAEVKTKRGTEGYGYNYFSLDDFLNQAKEICAKYGLCPVYNTEERKKSVVKSRTTQTFPDGSVSVTEILEEQFVFYGVLDVFESGGTGHVHFETPTCLASVKGASGIQNFGAMQTYTKRYLYQHLLEVSDGSDTQIEKSSDEERKNAESTPKSAKKATKTKDNYVEGEPDQNPEKATAQQIKLIKEQLEKENPEDQKNIMEYILSTYGVSSLEEMTVPQASDCLSRFE